MQRGGLEGARYFSGRSARDGRAKAGDGDASSPMAEVRRVAREEVGGPFGGRRHQNYSHGEGNVTEQGGKGDNVRPSMVEYAKE
jgi:hypothetical protein